MYKYNCLNSISEVGTKLFNHEYEETKEINEADVILVRSAAMHDMEMSDNLLAIARAGAGVNNIPVEKCAEKGIVVFNTPGANADSVKELVIAAMLLGARGIVEGIDWVKANMDDENIAKTAEKAKGSYAGNEIQGKKLGVIGLGAIGVRVANAAVDLNMTVFGYDPYISVDGAWQLSQSVIHSKSIEEICAQCDFITLHLPAVEDTKGMINKETLDLMKDGVVMLNFSRDTLVNDDDMAEALLCGKVKKYITDFPNAKTVKMERTIVIPHLGASTEESEDNCAVMAVKQLMDYIENGNIKNSVNYPNCNMGYCTNESRFLIHHRNIPNMIGQFTSAFAAENINISDMLNKSKGNNAYTMLDLDEKAPDSLVERIKSIEGVIRVRVVS